MRKNFFLIKFIFGFGFLIQSITALACTEDKSFCVNDTTQCWMYNSVDYSTTPTGYGTCPAGYYGWCNNRGYTCNGAAASCPFDETFKYKGPGVNPYSTPNTEPACGNLNPMNGTCDGAFLYQGCNCSCPSTNALYAQLSATQKSCCPAPPTPSPSPTPVTTPVASPSPSAPPPSPSPSPSAPPPSPSPSPSPSPTPSAPPPSPTPSPTPSAPPPSPTPSPTPSPSPSPSPSVVPPTGVPVASWNANYHACGPGSGAAIPASPVSNRVAGARANGGQFNNAENKRLSCCLNSSNGRVPSYISNPPNIAPPTGLGAHGFGEKYDCVDNSAQPASFNALWTTPVPGPGSHRSNAIVLRNSRGEAITGFYTLEGRRCQEFGEMNQIANAIVNPTIAAGQQMNTTANGVSVACTLTGQAIPAPAVGSPVTAAAPVCRQGANGGEALLRCPLLVRAAFQATCPKNSPNSDSTAIPVNRSYTDASGGGVVSCGVAGAVKIHLRIEQPFQIAGKPAFAPMDSVLDESRASNIDVRKMITSGR